MTTTWTAYEALSILKSRDGWDAVARLWSTLTESNGVTLVYVTKAIEERAVAFAKPVLLLQGDSHSYLVDTPIAGAPNVTRIVVEGAATASEWLELTVDPGSAAVFTWRRVGI